MHRSLALLLLALSLSAPFAKCSSSPNYTPAQENEILGNYLASKIPVHETAASVEVLTVQCEYQQRKRAELKHTGGFLKASQWYVAQLEGVSIEELERRYRKRAAVPATDSPLLQ